MRNEGPNVRLPTANRCHDYENEDEDEDEDEQPCEISCVKKFRAGGIIQG